MDSQVKKRRLRLALISILIVVIGFIIISTLVGIFLYKNMEKQGVITTPVESNIEMITEEESESQPSTVH